MLEPGICYIKEEFLVSEESKPCDQVPGQTSSASKKRTLATTSSNDTDNNQSIDESENVNEHNDGDDNNVPSQKYQKTNDNNNKKQRKRGQNKHRPVYKEDRALHLCHSLVNGADSAASCKFENCRYVHDLSAYMASKGPDLASVCPIFEAKGFCVRGVTCRYAQSHLDVDGRNIKAAHYDEAAATAMSTMNGITTELQVKLRKREFDFSRSKTAIADAEKSRDVSKQKKQEESAVDAKTESCSNDGEDEKPVGVVVDDSDVAAVERTKCRIDFREKLILSPLTTVGNLPFRRICKEFGADITCGEMACTVPLVKGLTQEWALTKRHKSEDIFGVQICGNNPNIIAQTAQLLQDTAQVDYLDLNIGCPIDLIYQQGGGSALMRRTNILELTVRSCAALLSPQIPFTVKMRTGVYADKSVAHELVPLVEEWGAAAVTLHGRSREQRYTRHANWEYIEECAAKARFMPVIGNGDILSFEDYNERRKIAPHVSSVMIGRGALIKPWIFQEIKEQKHWQPTSTQRFELLKKYVNYGLEHWGSDTKGVENTRRFLLEWQSFLYRYIPYDMLEYPPQRINQRPQKYRGRDEMETLMCSSNATDWVKLSEMLLGPVPEGFSFVPKHKANAY